MRVVHVATAFPRSEEDVITPWLLALIRLQRRQGVESEVLTSSYRGLGDQVISGIPVHRFRYAPRALETLTHDETVPDLLERRPLRVVLVAPYLAAGIGAAARIGRLDPPDVVHVHWPMPHALLGAALRRASGGRTAVVSSFYSAELNWTRERLPWLRRLVRWSARSADAITAISRSTAALVHELSDRTPTVIPFAAAVDGAAEGAARLPLAGGTDAPVRLLFVGRLVERKGVEVLIEALARIRERRAATLTVVGEGQWAAPIREAVRTFDLEDAVELTGLIPTAELEKKYVDADFFVLPAVYDRKGDTEGLGVVLLEAMRHGRPVIGSEAGGIPDIIEHGHTGWLVPPGNASALADTILRLCAAPDETRSVAERGRVETLRRFSWERILADLSAVYEEAIRVRRGG